MRGPAIDQGPTLVRRGGPLWIRASLRRLVLILGAVVFLTVLAPWDTNHLGVGRRALQFLLCTLSREVSVVLIGLALRRKYGDLFYGRSAWRMLLVLVISSLPASLGMLAAIGAVSGRWPPFFQLYMQSLPLGLVIAFARRGVVSG
ncbi:hypothetical protein HN018_10235 [Lichenicola cladoniae]|uniref:Uncharacterized protein n=1 Tax=Lichenicola cladoniae TaxID=1484109 RepID=A0A6M8HPM9_9PROT|nr:hypothetical protein [Lichenicola cladoniae]NPD66396.1 hypothetical protein [Acetobacteraceae bacterium]QKE90364.1 hypothetical protein HN018_10235 [Lichenicola cladoniae]